MVDNTSLLNKISIGTVQFGMQYGIKNNSTASIEQVNDILGLASQNNINHLDTAKLYEKSEYVIGQCKNSKIFDIVSKTSNLNSKNNIDNYFKDGFYYSLNLLNQNQIYGLLVHNVGDLLTGNGEYIYKKLLELKNNNKIKKIGVSVYTPKQAISIINKYDIDLIQIPINIFDQRFCDSTIDFLKSKNIEIHVRSIFLQGLLLMELNKIPNFFDPIKSNIELFGYLCNKLGYSKLELALLFVLKIKYINKIVIGVNDKNQLEQIIQAIKSIKNIADSFDINDLKNLAIKQEKFINPSLWQL